MAHPKTACCFFILYGLALPCAAVETLQSPIVVTATRQSQKTEDALSDVIVINREDIEQSGVTSLQELLDQQEGIHVASYGGPGKATSLYLRGSNQVMVMINGIRIGSVTTGPAALEQIPLSQIDRIEILHGSASSLYGSQAMGGVVQIFTRAPLATGADASFAYGTYRTQQGNVGASFRKEGWYATLRASDDETDGIKTIPERDKQPFSHDPSRQHDGFSNRSHSGQLGYEWNAGHDLDLWWLKTSGTSQYESGPGADTHANVAQFAGAVRGRVTWHEGWMTHLTVGRSEDKSRDVTPLTPDGALYRTRQNQWNLQQDINGRWGNIVLAFENLLQSGYSQSNFDLERTIRSALAGWSYQLGSHHLQLNLRRDTNSQFGDYTSAHGAYGYDITPYLRARLTLGNSYRAPTFNELYYPNFGNTNLKVEKSREHELGLDWQQWQNITGSLTYFDRRVKDLIVTICDAHFNCIPRNFDKATLRGISLGTAWRNDGTTIKASFDWLSARNDATDLPLAHQPARQFTLFGSQRLGAWNLGATLRSVSHTYDDAALTRRLGGYTLIDAFVHYALVKNVNLEVTGSNLTNKKYETIWGFASPGAAIMVGVKAMIH